MKIEASTVLIGATIIYFLTQQSKGNNSNNNSIPASGNFIQNGTVNVPGIGTLPAHQTNQGLVYVKLNGQWILLSVLQAYYDQVVSQNQNQGGNDFGDWLNNNAGNLIGILENILNGNTNNAGDLLIDLGVLLPRGQSNFRPL